MLILVYLTPLLQITAEKGSICADWTNNFYPKLIALFFTQIQITNENAFALLSSVTLLSSEI